MELKQKKPEYSHIDGIGHVYIWTNLTKYGNGLPEGVFQKLSKSLFSSGGCEKFYNTGKEAMDDFAEALMAYTQEQIKEIKSGS
jgi:hypothetical protein